VEVVRNGFAFAAGDGVGVATGFLDMETGRPLVLNPCPSLMLSRSKGFEVGGSDPRGISSSKEIEWWEARFGASAMV